MSYKSVTRCCLSTAADRGKNKDLTSFREGCIKRRLFSIDKNVDVFANGGCFIPYPVGDPRPEAVQRTQHFRYSSGLNLDAPLRAGEKIAKHAGQARDDGLAFSR